MTVLPDVNPSCMPALLTLRICSWPVGSTWVSGEAQRGRKLTEDMSMVSKMPSNCLILSLIQSGNYKTYSIQVMKINAVDLNHSYLILTKSKYSLSSSHSPPHKLKYKKWRPKKNSSAVGPHEVHWCQVCWLEKNWLGRFWEKQFFSFLGSSENFLGPPKPYLASETPTLGGSYF